jgi:hypothetical protein
MNNFPKVPESSGYGCWTNAVDPIDPLYHKAGLKINDSELSFRLENEEDSSDETKFKIHSRVIYSYRITLKDYPKSETERNSKGIEVEVSGDL